MKIKESIAFRNLSRRPGRTAALIVLCAFLCFSILAGSLFISSLRSGLDSLENRLGADIMVVPYEASTKSTLDEIILQGNPGYFYMNDSVLDSLAEIDGIEEMSAQFYLASATTSCCSVSVQIIGFDPETDFTVLPWLSNDYAGEIPGYQEAVVGCDLTLEPGDTLTFYGTTLTVVGKMEATGTYIDASVYTSTETIRDLMNYAYDNQIYNFGDDLDPDELVSCVLINVADGYDIQDVLDDINLHVSQVVAVQTTSLVSDVSEKLTAVSDITGILVVAIWILALVVLAVSFVMISNERKKEFAVMRAIGASRRKLSGIILKETLMESAVGSIVGAVLAIALLLLFEESFESMLGLPFLLPSGASFVLLTAASIVISMLAASIAAAVSAWRTGRTDTALILRGEN